MTWTAVYKKVPVGYVGFVEELPGANTQGTTLEETRANLAEAIELTLEANRVLAEEGIAGQDVVRESLEIGRATGRFLGDFARRGGSALTLATERIMPKKPKKQYRKQVACPHCRTSFEATRGQKATS